MMWRKQCKGLAAWRKLVVVDVRLDVNESERFFKEDDEHARRNVIVVVSIVFD